MPEIVSAAIISALGATGVAATAITVATNLAFALGATAVTQALSPQTRAAEGRATEWTPDPNAAIPFVFGRRGVAGIVVHQDAYGPDNRYLGRVTIYSGGGPINAYSTFLLNGTAQTFTGELMNGSPTNRLWRQTKTGAQPDTALTSPSVSGSYTMSGWTSSHKLSGYACSMITLRQDGDYEYWPQGIPKIVQVLQGMLSYDPRLDSTYPGGSGSCRLATPSTWVYSTNPIIAALKWALGIKHNGVLVGGIGSSVDGIDVDAFIAAANVADTNSWTVSAVAYSDAPSGDDKYQVFEALLQAGGAVPARKQGKISCISRANAPSSVVTITAADTAGAFEFVPASRRDRRINTVIPRCVQEDHDWELVDLEPVSDSTYVTEDGGATRSRGVTYAYVSDEDQAAQLAAYDVANSREWEPFTIPLKPYLRDLDPGDAFTIDDSDLGISSQKFLVLARTYDPATDTVEVTCTTETNAKHAWALGLSGTAPSSPTLGFSDPLTVPTPSGSDWSIAAGTGTVPALVVTGAVPSTVTVKNILPEYKRAADSVWIPLAEVPPSTTKIEFPGLTANTSYNVRLTYRSIFGSLGATLSLSATTTGYVQGGGIAPSTVDTTQLATKAALASGIYFSTPNYSVPSQSVSSSSNQKFIDFTVTVPSDTTRVRVIYDVLQQTSGTNDYDYVLYADAEYNFNTSADVPVGYVDRFTQNEASGSAVKRQITRSKDLVLAAGSHTFRLYLRNTSGGIITLKEARMEVICERKSAL